MVMEDMPIYNEVPNDSVEQQIPDYNDYTILSRVSISELIQNCFVTVLHQGFLFTFPILLLCVLFKILYHTVGDGFEESGMSFIPRQIIHVSSASLGIVIFHHLFGENLLVVLILAPLCYLSFLFTSRIKRYRVCGLTCIICCVAVEILCEFFMPFESWHKVRGPMMILSMKIVSIGFDLDSDLLLIVPGIFEYMGYVFHVGTIVFGPWISFLDYMMILQIKERQLSFTWFFKVVQAYLQALLCLLYSTCITSWLILDGSYKWFIAYRDAQSFRFSHYFTSYVSQATALASGVGAVRVKDETRWELRVSRPGMVEKPRSLVEVVVGWNVPMHRWMRQYIFQPTKKFGSFPAIACTYLASSLLHGLNFQIAAVLLSLGLYTYTEYVLRKKLGVIFDMCIEARPCRTCNHSDKNSYRVRLVNFCLSLLSVYHLAYLGLLFDAGPGQERGYGMQHTLSKWAHLDYSSHWVALVTLIFYLLIK